MLGNVRKTLGLLSPSEKRKLYFVFAGMLVMAFLEVVGIGSIMPFMTVAADPTQIHQNDYLRVVYNGLGFRSESQFLIFLGGAVFAFLLFGNLAKALIKYAVLRFSSMRRHTLSLRMLKSYLYQPYTYFLNRNSADLSKNILAEVNSVVDGVIVFGLELITRVILVIAIITFLLFVDPVLALIVAVVLAGAYATIYGAIRSLLLRMGKERIEANSRRYKLAGEAFGGIKDVKVLGKEDVYADEFKRPSFVYAKNEALSNAFGELPKFALETIAFGSILVIALYLISTEGSFQRIIPIVSVYAFAGYRLMPALQQIFRSLTRLRYNLPTVDLLFTHLQEAAGNIVPRAGDANQPIPLTKELALREVDFYYPATDLPTLRDFTVSIDVNTTVGFVGATGSGKTTTVDLILGLLRPQKGALEVDGTAITDNRLRRWQRSVGYIPQHIYLTDDTVTRNIAFGVPEDQINREAVIDAAKAAHLHEFVVNEMPSGYESIVGERGVRLSGGQRQRIGIARALYQRPSVIVMDEATSALDGVTERAIMEAINELSHKKTIVMIAHRLSTVRGCDVIHVMDHGKLVDSGTYEELLLRNEQFRRMAGE